MTIKFSDEQLKKWGFASQEEIVAALEKSTAPPKPAEPAAIAPTPAAAVKTEIVAVSPELLSRLAAVEASVKALAPETILASVGTEAKRVASLEISAAIAKAGGAALQQKSDPADPAAGKSPVDPNDYGAQYDANAVIREEFLSKASYVKYMEAQKDGRIRIHVRTPEAVNKN
jgi:hypothetical protein